MLAKKIFSYQADEVGFKAFVDFFRCKEEMASQPSFILHHGDALYRYCTPVVLEEPREGGSIVQAKASSQKLEMVDKIEGRLVEQYSAGFLYR